ncbi:potassium channel family protein [Streptomyces sp. NPDC059740]|uniref:potassium channel family protein n=1 Tax=Streptomyces sp. NPDC059740 TaxID=3346926 RepID=UPI0036567D20
METAESEKRLLGWEWHGFWPLMAASGLFLAAYAVLVLDTSLHGAWRTLWWVVLLACWGLFVADYLVRLVLAEDRRRFVRTRWLDLVVTLLPLLRPVRVVDVQDRVRLREARPRLGLEARVMAYTGLATVLIGFAAALAVYQAERGTPGTTVRDFGDALWWASSALTTTGYGDVVPVTARGRTVGAVLGFLGVALVGAVVGSFSSWLLRRFDRREQS